MVRSTETASVIWAKLSNRTVASVIWRQFAGRMHVLNIGCWLTMCEEISSAVDFMPGSSIRTPMKKLGRLGFWNRLVGPRLSSMSSNVISSSISSSVASSVSLLSENNKKFLEFNANQSIHQSINQSNACRCKNQSINQSINRWITNQQLPFLRPCQSPQSGRKTPRRLQLTRKSYPTVHSYPILSLPHI